MAVGKNNNLVDEGSKGGSKKDSKGGSVGGKRSRMNSSSSNRSSIPHKQDVLPIGNGEGHEEVYAIDG